MSFQETASTIYHSVVILKLNAPDLRLETIKNKSEEMSLIHSISVQIRESQVPEPIIQQLL